MDEGLVVLAQQGDREAFESLTRALYTRLYRVAKSILRDRHTAEDAPPNRPVSLYHSTWSRAMCSEWFLPLHQCHGPPLLVWLWSSSASGLCVLTCR